MQMNKQTTFKLLKLFHADVISLVYLIDCCVCNSVFPPGASSPGDVALSSSPKGDGFEIGDAGIMHLTEASIPASALVPENARLLSQSQLSHPPQMFNHQKDQATPSKAQNKSQSLFLGLVNTLPL